MRVFNYATILVVLSVLLVPGVNAIDLSAEYLHGRWVIDDQNCSSPDSEYMEFNKNGTFEGTRTGQAEIVGFWGLKEGILDLHMMTSPAFFDDLHKDLARFEGIYHYLQARMIIFNTQNKSFEAFGVIGDQIKRASAVRCP
ncbi:MAG: hypothetical protein KJP23_21610 [Deltaproteobacteria bacterium]|nr:hypothetical protein [Deltaproteobacteria bacterium]